MSDDPTTTGPQKPNGVLLVNGEPPQSGAQIAALLRGVQGADVSEITPYSFKWDCNLAFLVTGGELTVTMDIKDKDGEQVIHSASVGPGPVAQFGGPAALNAFLAELKRNLNELLRVWLAAEACEHMVDIYNYLLGVMGVVTVDKAWAADRHAAVVRQRVWDMLEGLPEKRAAGGWSKIALHRAVMAAAMRLAMRGKTGRALTLDAVNDEIRDQLGANKAAASGGALRKRLEERGLSWRSIKSAVERTAKAEAERRAASPVSGPPGRGENGG